MVQQFTMRFYIPTATMYLDKCAGEFKYILWSKSRFDSLGIHYIFNNIKTVLYLTNNYGIF